MLADKLLIVLRGFRRAKTAEIFRATVEGEDYVCLQKFILFTGECIDGVFLSSIVCFLFIAGIL